MAKQLTKPKSLKAQMTRTNLVLAAAALLREAGPAAVTYRRVAEWAGASSSSVGYYFSSVTDLLYEAGRFNIDLWVERAERAADEALSLDAATCRRNAVPLILQACLPAGSVDGSVSLAAHYAQLIAASESSAVTDAYRQGRERLDGAIDRILKHADIPVSAALVSATVDGAAVKAVSEGLEVKQVASELLGDAFSQV